MTKYKSGGFKASFYYALKGLRVIFKSEKNFRIHCFFAFIVFCAGVMCNFSAIELCILILTSSLVLVCEMVNSALEYALDATFKNKYSQLVGFAKDIAAGMVLFSAAISVLIGILLFSAKFLN